MKPHIFVKRIQLGLIHVAVAMTLVPINSTLNRVMIKEFAISATLVAVLASLPYLFSPIQVFIGSLSDRNPIWGLRRTPYILMGLLLCVLGVVFSPYTAFALSNNLLAGVVLGMVTFGAWGMGFNLATVSYLSLASELSGEKNRGKTIAVMWFMMISSIILTAIVLSNLVDPYTPEALVRSFLWVGLAAAVLGVIGLVKLEIRSMHGVRATSEHPSWGVMIRGILENRQATLFFWYLVILLAAILGQDIILEPFGGEAFGLSVKSTTRITSIWGSCVLVALLIAGGIEGRINKRVVAKVGGWGALIGFIFIAASGLLRNPQVFYAGVILLGFGTGLSTVSNLSLMLDMTTAGNVGLFIGAWGMANAFSRLIGTILGGAVRDLVTYLSRDYLIGYIVVFIIEAGMIALSLAILSRIDVGAFQKRAQRTAIIEQVSAATDL